MKYKYALNLLNINHYNQLSDKIQLHAGVEEMLSTFADNNLNQIILSAFKTNEITKYARKFSIEHYFEDILGTQNIVMESKTAEDICRNTGLCLSKPYISAIRYTIMILPAV